MTRRTATPKRAPRGLLLAGALAGLFVNAGTAIADYRALADQFIAKYPAACTGSAVTTGLCLLGATSPRASGDFLLSVPTVGPAAGQDIPVPLNTNVPLAPGQYQLYQRSGLDRYQPLYFAVEDGAITTIKTATVKFQDQPGRYIKLQHWQARDGVDGAGCEAEIGNKGAHALLPGIYQASLVPSVTESGPTCEHDGVAFFASPGQGVTLRTASLVENDLPAGNRYRHSSDAIALATVDPLRLGVREIGLLPTFQSYRGVHFPGSAKVSGLVLAAPPGFALVVPIKVGPGSECGVSLPYGGIPARLLLGDCTFDGDGDLTGFTVNAGNYFALDNLSGKTGMAGHAINSPIVVRNVKINLKGK